MRYDDDDDDSGEVCADTGCYVPRPAMAMECGLGWTQVGDDIYCPSHGGGASYRARKRLTREQQEDIEQRLRRLG